MWFKNNAHQVYKRDTFTLANYTAGKRVVKKRPALLFEYSKPPAT